ncbi:bacteriohemerythrin [Clostridium folliculivorans]|uniref:Bacteriohemerythrin n=1 Tax=Clostridium folliculivorans TaxID=2886038 RepID=A0A9W5Y151_9CLOT|nr:hemerythrin family protein [Clostridium folliculivorans]GKU24683.1 bacteriohemerythrin [Clostridium folliculivorans]GKU30781.1 bacteriohemerythrin [Clostridium folliculivorans]
MFEWSMKYETGSSFIDDNHKKLFEIGYDIVTFIQSESNEVSRCHLTNALKDFITYAKFSFSIEEDYMSEIEYAEFVSHRQEHYFFIKRLCYYDFDEIITNKESSQTLFEFIYSWLDQHMISEDLKLFNKQI